ncbi:hypothetical protein, partial [Ammoniphilus resinae]|uniref:hypothetical protein n=1 Tax=Ammoniphilus resinae TaxID=861532 RepID=UPI001AE9B7AA
IYFSYYIGHYIRQYLVRQYHQLLVFLIQLKQRGICLVGIDEQISTISNDFNSIQRSRDLTNGGKLSSNFPGSYSAFLIPLFINQMTASYNAYFLKPTEVLKKKLHREGLVIESGMNLKSALSLLEGGGHC